MRQQDRHDPIPDGMAVTHYPRDAEDTCSVEFHGRHFTITVDGERTAEGSYWWPNVEESGTRRWVHGIREYFPADVHTAFWNGLDMIRRHVGEEADG